MSNAVFPDKPNQFFVKLVAGFCCNSKYAVVRSRGQSQAAKW